jgi:cytochrome c oxidase subunit 2
MGPTRAAIRVIESAMAVPAGSSPPAPVCPPQNTSIFSPATEQAARITEVTWLVIGICLLIFVVVEALLVYAIIRYRRRRDAGPHDPPQVYGSGPIELAWTVVPILIVVVLGLVATRGVFSIDTEHPPPHALPVSVIAHQWWWEFRYPDQGIVTANELVVPLSDPDEPRPIALSLQSADVVHSFWVPRLAGKKDVFPHRINTIWFDPTTAGVYHGQCSEYCGRQHAHMLILVRVLPKPEWEQWVRAQQAPAAEVPSGAAGREIFLSTACVKCHTVRGTPADGTFAPDLTHLQSRTTIAAGTLANTHENLLRWVTDPQQVKPGCNMPAMQLRPDQIEQVVAYLETLH